LSGGSSPWSDTSADDSIVSKKTSQDHSERIAVLEVEHKSRSRKSIGWSSAAATVIVAVGESVRACLK
jgi:hypothetical protein